DRLSREQRMRTARVVADHSAERAPRVRRRIGAESQPMRFGRRTQIVEHDARLNSRDPRHRIDLQDRRHIPAEVDDDGFVAALTGERRPSTSTEYRYLEPCTYRQSADDVRLVAREHDA